MKKYTIREISEILSMGRRRIQQLCKQYRLGMFLTCPRLHKVLNEEEFDILRKVIESIRRVKKSVQYANPNVVDANRN